MIRFRVPAALFLLVILCGGFANVYAQTASTGQLVGDITDASGAAIPKATILVKDAATGENRAVTSDRVGHYVVPLLPPGTYTVSGALTGFSTQTASDVTVHAAPTVDERLPPTRRP